MRGGERRKKNRIHILLFSAWRKASSGALGGGGSPALSQMHGYYDSTLQVGSDGMAEIK